MGGGRTFDPDSVTIQKIDCTYPSGEPKFNVTLTMADGTTSTFGPDKEQVVRGLSVDGNTLKVSYNGGQTETSLELPKGKTVDHFELVNGALVLYFNDGSRIPVPLPAHTDKFVSSATLSGQTLKLGYNDETNGPSVDLPKALTNASFAGNVLTLSFNDGSSIPVTIPIPAPSADKYVTGGSVTGNQLTLNYNLGGTTTPITLPKVVSDVTKDGENLIIKYSDGTQSNPFNLPAPKNHGVYKGGNGTWYYDDGKSDRVYKRLSTTGINGSATGLNASITGMNVGATGLSVSLSLVSNTLVGVSNTLYGVNSCGQGLKNEISGFWGWAFGTVTAGIASLVEAVANRNNAGGADLNYAALRKEINAMDLQF